MSIAESEKMEKQSSQSEKNPHTMATNKQTNHREILLLNFKLIRSLLDLR